MSNVSTSPEPGVPADTPLRLKGDGPDWVGRGAIKLAHGLDVLGIDPKGLIAADIGASTGGFTEVLLSRGTAKVFAVDVGHGQLHWKLRNDPRVVVLERTNARYLTTTEIPEPLELVVCDASFISMQKVLGAALELASPGALCVALVKPQFQAQRSEVGKGGVVRGPAVRARVVEEVLAWLEDVGWRPLGTSESPIRGPKGNLEIIVAARKEKRER